jgi:hypothetical protein
VDRAPIAIELPSDSYCGAKPEYERELSDALALISPDLYRRVWLVTSHGDPTQAQMQAIESRLAAYEVVDTARWPEIQTGSAHDITVRLFEASGPRVAVEATDVSPPTVADR